LEVVKFLILSLSQLSSISCFLFSDAVTIPVDTGAFGVLESHKSKFGKSESHLFTLFLSEIFFKSLNSFCLSGLNALNSFCDKFHL